jgi:hypothetical protein
LTLDRVEAVDNEDSHGTCCVFEPETVCGVLLGLVAKSGDSPKYTSHGTFSTVHDEPVGLVAEGGDATKYTGHEAFNMLDSSDFPPLPAISEEVGEQAVVGKTLSEERDWGDTNADENDSAMGVSLHESTVSPEVISFSPGESTEEDKAESGGNELEPPSAGIEFPVIEDTNLHEADGVVHLPESGHAAAGEAGQEGTNCGPHPPLSVGNIESPKKMSGSVVLVDENAGFEDIDLSPDSDSDIVADKGSPSGSESRQLYISASALPEKELESQHKNYVECENTPSPTITSSTDKKGLKDVSDLFGAPPPNSEVKVVAINKVTTASAAAADLFGSVLNAQPCNNTVPLSRQVKPTRSSADLFYGDMSAADPFAAVKDTGVPPSKSSTDETLGSRVQTKADYLSTQNRAEAPNPWDATRTATADTTPFSETPETAFSSQRGFGQPEASLMSLQDDRVEPRVVPASAIAALAVPALAVPALAVPALAVPALAVPALAVPALAVPALAVPALAVPSNTVAGSGGLDSYRSDQLSATPNTSSRGSGELTSAPVNAVSPPKQVSLLKSSLPARPAGFPAPVTAPRFQGKATLVSGASPFDNPASGPSGVPSELFGPPPLAVPCSSIYSPTDAMTANTAFSSSPSPIVKRVDGTGITSNAADIFATINHAQSVTRVASHTKGKVEPPATAKDLFSRPGPGITPTSSVNSPKLPPGAPPSAPGVRVPVVSPALGSPSSPAQRSKEGGAVKMVSAPPPGMMMTPHGLVPVPKSMPKAGSSPLCTNTVAPTPAAPSPLFASASNPDLAAGIFASPPAVDIGAAIPTTPQPVLVDPAASLKPAPTIPTRYNGYHFVGRPVCPVAAFGFGGKIAVMMPVVRQVLNPLLLTPDERARPFLCGAIVISRIVDLVNSYCTLLTLSDSAKTNGGEIKQLLSSLMCFPGTFLRQYWYRGTDSEINL